MFNPITAEGRENGRAWHSGKNITSLTLPKTFSQKIAHFFEPSEQVLAVPNCVITTMHFQALLTAVAALVVSIGPVIAVPEDGLQHRAAALDAELESRAQCSGALNVAGSRCAHQGHTSCSASRGAVVSEQSPLPG